MDTCEAQTSPTEGESGEPTYDAFVSYSHDTDSAVAPRLQSGLQRFAKPWWKRQTLRVFRDESSLAANPHLWSSITEAMDDSAWMVLLDRGNAIMRPVFAPDGGRMYGAEFKEGAISVFDTETWAELDPIEIGGVIRDLAISPDGSRLSAAGDAFVTVVDLETGEQERIAFGYDESLGTLANNVAFTDDNHVILTPIVPGSVFVMTLDPAELVDVARARMTQGLTAEECATYAIDPCPTLEEIEAG